MRLLVRSLGSLALVLVPVVALAQGAGPATTGILGTPPAPTPPPPGGGTAAPAGPGAAAGNETAKSTNSIGGVSFNDKPARRAPTGRVAPRRTGPLATFPGFEQLPDGGSRLSVHLSQSVPVEERRAQGSVTYVLRGAHLRVHNDANPLVTVHFNTPVVRARLTPQGSDLLFVLELRSAAAPTFKLQDTPDKSATLQIDFPKGDFITGDGSETLPPTTKPNLALGRVPRGKNGSSTAPSPATPTTPAPASGDPGPTP